MVLKKPRTSPVTSSKNTSVVPVSMRGSDRLVILAVLLMPIPSFLGDAAARVADAARFGTVSGRLMMLSRWGWGHHVGRLSVVLLAMFFCAALSMAFGISHSIRDLLDVLRIFAFWTVFMFGASLAARHPNYPAAAAASVLELLLTIGVVNAAFTVAQFLFPNATRPLQEIFATGARHMDMLEEQGRAFGFFVNPNTNANMLLLLSLPGVALFQLTRRKLYLMCGCFVFAAVLITASRTGLILSGVVIAVLCIASRRWTYMLALCAIGALAYQFLNFLVDSGNVRDWFPYLSELLIKIHATLHGDYFDVESINSFNARLAIWDRTLEWYYAEPLLGSGPLREVIPSFADNYYIYMLSRYGTLGLSLYCLYTAYVAYLGMWAIWSNRRPQREWGTITLASLAIVNVSNYTIDAFLIVPIATVCLLYAGYLACLMQSPVGAMTPLRRAAAIRRPVATR